MLDHHDLAIKGRVQYFAITDALKYPNGRKANAGYFRQFADARVGGTFDPKVQTSHSVLLVDVAKKKDWTRPALSAAPLTKPSMECGR